MIEILVDTNIFIYALNADSEYNSRCTSLLSGENNLFTTSKNISEYFAVCSKLNVDHEVVWSFYQSILSNVIVLYPNEISLKYFENLLLKYQPVGNRVFDLEIVSVMITNGLETLATFNNKDFKSISEINLLEF